ncbi:nucleotidyl transferase AbiEii/AbiGii toxin family protein [Duganella sp. FT50W]|uniref:Nucleotidyl transferase AbiEii/AbiGii toxin family protein n=2 Tax=Duganella lactea TaxID=2692173 RepID=A0A6L8MSL4_9BURK|nr:nucleotidyl transferase AbiEii/AbiGii toxin family protein [Duganella lactea]
MVGTPGIPHTWETLFSQALKVISEIARHGRDDPFWTFGGGTVLMLRYGHRFSKDIDIFVPDPQSLGFVTPRLSDVAESITTDYVEAAGYVKLYLPEGEIDFVAAPNLTAPGFQIETILGHQVRVETSVEIIAKKMWHRGDRITGRDIFDFALIAEREPEVLMEERKFMTRHATAVFQQLDERYTQLKQQFDAVDALNFHLTFDQASHTLKGVLTAMLEAPDPGRADSRADGDASDEPISPAP